MRIRISTHAPLAGRDGRARWYTIPKSVFQPTRPLRGATFFSSASVFISLYFNPRAPCGARLEKILFRVGTILFQPTRPLRGATSVFRFPLWRLHKFQPTRPLRGATSVTAPYSEAGNISTHAPLAGRDERLPFSPLALTQISTHAPLAGRDVLLVVFWSSSPIFQPTRPLRGATFFSSASVFISLYFNPRAPCGARLSITIAKIHTN